MLCWNTKYFNHFGRGESILACAQSFRREKWEFNVLRRVEANNIKPIRLGLMNSYQILSRAHRL